MLNGCFMEKLLLLVLMMKDTKSSDVKQMVVLDIPAEVTVHNSLHFSIPIKIDAST